MKIEHPTDEEILKRCNRLFYEMRIAPVDTDRLNYPWTSLDRIPEALKYLIDLARYELENGLHDI